MPRAAPFPLGAAISLVVAACASVPSAPPPAPLPMRDAPFVIDGRLSARRGNDAISVAFAWTHAAPRDDLLLTTPLGQALAELAGDASIGRVEVRMADGRREEASDWSALTARLVGFPLPVGGLAWWAQGAARADAPHSVEYDAAGRANVLRQDGCEIVYTYGDASTRRPSRLNLACHDLEMRIVIDNWRVS
jgi:outer membrane lipoprotein LolB